MDNPKIEQICRAIDELEADYLVEVMKGRVNPFSQGEIAFSRGVAFGIGSVARMLRERYGVKRSGLI